VNWTAQRSLGQSSRSGPALAQLGGVLYLAYVANNNSAGLLVTASADLGMNWRTQVTVGTPPQSAATDPALAALDRRLVLAYVAHTGSRDLLISTSANGNDWTGQVRVGQQSATSAALAVFEDQLILAFVADNQERTLLTCMSADGVSWSGNSIV
jgi:hypothetical protein